MFVEILTIIVFLLVTLKLIISKNPNLPPGPSKFPLLGFWPSSLGPKPYDTFDLWAKRYGEVFRVKLGGKEYFVLNSYDVIRQGYVLDGNGNNFNNRPRHSSILGSAFEFRSVGFTSGPEWALQRRLYGNAMRKSDPKIDSAIRTSADEIIRQITHNCDQGPINVYDILAEQTLNVISTLVMGGRLVDIHPEFARSIVEDARTVFGVAPAGDGLMAGWILRLLTNPFTKISQITQTIKNRQFKAMEKLLCDQASTFDPTIIRHFVDTSLSERLKRKNTESKEWLKDRNLMANMLMFFASGIDTTATTLYFSIFLLAKHQTVQEKCFAELKSVVGDHCTEVSPSDKEHLPYVTAVINEINRYISLAPIPTPRETMTKTNIGGWEIPAKACILPNLWTALRDPKYFVNPHEFDPNNFYEKALPADLLNLPFLVGKRKCPGENLAMAELFVVLVQILLTFKISPKPGVVLEENPTPGFLRGLTPFKVMFLKR